VQSGRRALWWRFSAGREVEQEIRATRADLPIILTTGYSATLTTERVQAMGIQKLLLKPQAAKAAGAK